MTRIEAVRSSYDAVAQRYAEEIGDELIAKPVDRALYHCFAELVREHVGAGRPVGDVGCGPGHVTRHLTGLGLTVVGVDVSPAMVRVAGLRHPHLRFELGTFAALPVADGGWAGAVAPYSIIHLDRDGRRLAFAELARAIAPGGWLLVTFHISDADAAAGEVRHLTDWWDTPVQLDFHFLDPAEVAGEMAAAGFAVMARTEREPWPDGEHASRRGYLLARRR
ncbi:MAG TPA: class I SAM-dependent methyltransferase [Pilimelia sp.]|nr:class I SAM-dependent methyltransferase [Pilimelia sp.]